MTQTLIGYGRAARRSDRTDPALGERPRHRPLPGGWQDRPVVAEAVEKYQRSVEVHAAAVEEWQAADELATQARESDATATADALLAGKRDPGPVEASKVADTVAQAQRRLEALHNATRDAARAVNEAYLADREPWREQARGEREKVEAQAGALLEKALDRMAEAEQLRARVAQLHPKGKPAETGTRHSLRRTPYFPTSCVPVQAVEIVRDWLTWPYESED